MNVFRIFGAIIIGTLILVVFFYAGVLMYETLGFLGLLLYAIMYLISIIHAFFN